MKITFGDIILFILLLVVFSLIEGNIVEVIFPTIIITFLIKYFFLNKKDGKKTFKKSNNISDIDEQIEESRKIAESKGIPNMIIRLYFDNIQYYPSWKKIEKEENKQHTSSLITEATGKENIKITLKDNLYIFNFKKNEVPFYKEDVIGCGTLEILDKNNKKIFVLELDQFSTDYDTFWAPDEINGFIDGKWVNDFKELQKDINILSKKRLKQITDEHKKDKINKIKGNFNL